MGFMERGWNSLLTLPSSVFCAQREKQRALVFLKKFFKSRDALELFRGKSACAAHPSPCLGSGTHGLLQLQPGKKIPERKEISSQRWTHCWSPGARS